MSTHLRQALRSLSRSPGLSTVIIITLALGIGTNTALFSVFRELVLAPLALPEPGRLVRVWANNPERNLLAPAVSAPKYELFASQQRSFGGIAASLINGFMLSRNGAAPEQLPALQVTASWIPTVGVPLLRGRNFTAEEDSEAGARVVILTEDCWRNRFGADEAILGRSLELSGTSHTVIGIARTPMPRPVAFVQLIVPRALEGVGLTPEQIESGVPFLQVTARLKPGVTSDQADAEVRALSQRFRDAYPGSLDSGNANELRTWIEEIVGGVRPTMLALLAAVGLVLVIACVNVSNLLLGRLASRTKEIAVRLSLGATRRALLGQFMGEAVLYGALATTAGILIAHWSLALVPRLLASQVPADARFTMDGWTLAFTILVSTFTCAAVGLIPALYASQPHLADRLRDAARGSTAGAQGVGFRSGLVVVEVALSVLLLVGAGLLFTSFLRLQSSPPGFDRRGAATSAINIPAARYQTPAHQFGAIERVLEKLRSHPQVRRVAAGSSRPVGFLSGAPRAPYAVLGRPIPPADQRSFAALMIASDDYFATLGVPLKAGRALSIDDRPDTPLAAVINESFARRLFPDEDPVGRTILRGPNGEFAHQIVGVVGDVKSLGIATPPPDTLYVSLRQVTVSFVTLVATTDGDPEMLQSTFREAVGATDPGIAVTLFQTLESALRSTFDIQRIVATLTGLFAGLALLLALLGLYSVLAYAVAQRTTEIGIRMALGATGHDVLSLVIRQGLRLVVAGVIVGLAGALASSQLLQRLLFEVRPLDPLIYLAVSASFIAISLVACLVPARRATRVDPLTALRSD